MLTAYDKLLASESGRRELSVQHTLVNVANLIASLIESKSMNQRELAEKMDLTEGRVAQILSGSANLTLSSIAKILSAFDCVLDVSCRSIYDKDTKPVWNFHNDPHHKISQHIVAEGLSEEKWNRLVA